MNDKILENGYRLTYSNAESLISDADYLKKDKRLARSYTLYQLAIEEIGKCRLLWKAIIEYYQGFEISRHYSIENGYTKHEIKTKESLTSEWMAIWMYEQYVGERQNKLRSGLMQDLLNLSQINLRKNRRLYVDVNDDKFVAPVDEITVELVDEIEYRAKIRLKAEEPVLVSLENMKELAIQLKELEDNPEKLEALFEKYPP